MYGILSITKNFAVGKNGGLIVDSPIDMKHFRDVTCGSLFGKKRDPDSMNTIVMGRKTFESLKTPLKKRYNVVVSSTMEPRDDVKVFKSFTSCFRALKKKPYNQGQIFIISCSLIEQAMSHDILAGLILTRFEHVIEEKADTFLNTWFMNSEKWVADVYNTQRFTRFYTQPPIDIDKWEKAEDRYLGHFYKKLTKEVYDQYIPTKIIPKMPIVEHWKFVNHDEKKFQNLFREIMQQPNSTPNRTGICTKSIFGYEQTFDISSGCLPTSTIRSAPIKHIFEELMWYLRGSTDAKELMAKNIHVWDGNTTREFLDNVGLSHYEVGDIGPTYGFAFRYYGAEYKGCDYDYTGQGFDQLREVIRLIKEDPTSRRIIINLYNPAVLKECALPPCAFCYQFHVDIHEKTLSCKLTQRSSDILLAGMWNVTTVTLLTRILAHFTGLKPGKIIWSAGNVHIYENQWPMVEEICSRTPKPFPLLQINAKSDKSDTIDDILNKILDLEYKDLDVLGYHPDEPIKLIMN